LQCVAVCCSVLQCVAVPVLSVFAVCATVCVVSVFAMRDAVCVAVYHTMCCSVRVAVCEVVRALINLQSMVQCAWQMYCSVCCSAQFKVQCVCCTRSSYMYKRALINFAECELCRVWCSVCCSVCCSVQFCVVQCVCCVVRGRISSYTHTHTRTHNHTHTHTHI